MARYNGEPSFSCPDIDEAISEINKTGKLIQDLYNNETLGRAEDMMEKVRKDNEDLRKWGKGLASELEDAQNEIESLKQTIRHLEDQLETV